ncbi:queuine tRNA-ribosyltransferase accessory subunit 2 [Anaeramoeba flamelloides]|uniref:Queuine tRNA-ribosyltransferase accessory subunit 2 n=1 Tax=Anaeramoeba flamelloides TaxID=1746091 RepID=A0ABQ8YR49_9EUKA|nr:queuine tRNA-ribosyltransferase accessory subunit 2 [Anaeramoeba flamelloides]
MFIITHEEENRKSRLGKLTLPKSSITLETPCFICSTQRGFVRHLTPDNLINIPDIELLSINLPQIVYKPGLTTLKRFNKHCQEKESSIEPKKEKEKDQLISNKKEIGKEKEKEQEKENVNNLKIGKENKIVTEKGTNKNNQAKDGLKRYYGIGSKKALFLKIRNSEFAGFYYPSTDEKIACCSSEGTKIFITPSEYMEFASEINPDITVSPAIEVVGNNKRDKIEKQVKRSLKWLNLAISKKTSRTGSLFAVLYAIEDPKIRNKYLDQLLKVVKNGKVDGFVFGCLFLNESRIERKKRISDITELLPKELPRSIVGDATLSQILDCVEGGIDLINSSFPLKLTELNLVLNYQNPLQNIRSENENNNQKKNKNEDIENENKKQFEPLLMNLRNIKYEDDNKPFVVGCQCFACKNHTRKYVYHLISVREMTAMILMNLHNIYQYSLFFKDMRWAIKNHKFIQFKEAIELLEKSNLKK